MKTLLKMSRKQKFWGICAMIILYIIISITTNIRIEKMIDTSHDNLGKENPYTFAIGDEEFKRLNARSGYLPRMEGDPRYREEYSRTPVKTVHCFLATVSRYTYTYELIDEYLKEGGFCIHGSWGIPVTIISVLGRVIYIYEAP